MKERPILMSAPMVRAILDGTKTQTRRVVKPAPTLEDAFVGGVMRKTWIYENTADPAGWLMHNLCPYGKPGDRLWVRETCRAEELPDGLDGVRYLADDGFVPIENTERAADQWVDLGSYGMKFSGSPECRVVPSIHMPRWASRILLEITAVRVERLHDIIRGDAMEEGCPFKNMANGDDPRAWYRDLWGQINGHGNWDVNPWVWVVAFKRVTP